MKLANGAIQHTNERK